MTYSHNKKTWKYVIFLKQNLELRHISKKTSGLTSPGEHDGQCLQALTELTQGRPALDIDQTNSINQKNKHEHIIINAIYLFKTNRHMLYVNKKNFNM